MDLIYRASVTGDLMFLYKYRADNKYTEKVFTEQKIWLSNAKDLNDPFECKITEIAKEWVED